MKKALKKDFWMEIRKSPARFISIFFIVALGVAFFSGIQASSPDMRASGDAYFDANHLMDIKVVSTLGFEEKDIQALSLIHIYRLSALAFCASWKDITYGTIRFHRWKTGRIR